MTRTPPPPDGFHAGVPFAEYLAWDAINASTLKHARRSAAHAKEEIDRPSESSSAMDFGIATHAAILEPDRYAAEMIVRPEWNRRTNAGKEAEAAFYAEHDGRIIVSQDEADRIERVRAAVKDSALARKLSGTKGQREVSMVWRQSGLACKGRIDKLIDLGDVYGIVDLKTTRDASEDFFPRDAKARGYHRAGSWYADGIKALTGKEARVFIIAVESEAPHGACAYEISCEALEVGRREFVVAYQRLSEAMKSGVWGNYDGNILRTIEPTPWEMKRVGM